MLDSLEMYIEKKLVEGISEWQQLYDPGGLYLLKFAADAAAHTSHSRAARAKK